MFNIKWGRNPKSRSANDKNMNFFKKHLIKLIRLNNTPAEIALGVAVGVFIGVTPLYGAHTLMVVLFAILIPRTNKIAMLAGSNLSNPLTAPFISCTAYQIGRAVLGKNFPPIHWKALRPFNYSDIWNILYPLFLGSLIIVMSVVLL